MGFAEFCSALLTISSRLYNDRISCYESMRRVIVNLEENLLNKTILPTL